MGTRGYFVYRFRGRYYVLYNHYDSYPSGMGQWLVDQIPQDPEAYQSMTSTTALYCCANSSIVWLEGQRVKFAKWDDVLEKEVLCIKDINLQAISHYNSGAHRNEEFRLSALLDERLEQNLIPCYKPPENDMNIEWVYIIDLDREVFTIDNGGHFKLDKIPRDCWIESLALDSDMQRLVLPSEVPSDCIASLISKPTLEVSGEGYEDHKVEIVTPKGYQDFPVKIRHGPLILSNLWCSLRFDIERTMAKTLLGLTPEDFAFREIAFGIVSLAAGLMDSLLIRDYTRLSGPVEQGWMGLVDGEDPYGHVTLVSKLGYGCHAEGIEPGSCPQENTFWFKGVLIQLTAQLNLPGVLRQATSDAVGVGRSQSQTPTFDILLISIEHVVIVRVSGQCVQRTEPLPLLQIPIHYTKHPNDRYDLDMRNAIEGWETEAGEEENSKAEHPSSTQNSTSEDNNIEVVDDSSQKPTRSPRYCPDPVYGPGTRDPRYVETPEDTPAFMAMIHLFEAAAVRPLKPARTNEGVFPSELYGIILDLVDDDTYRACSRVSRRFRRLCLENLRLFENVVIHGVISRDEMPSSAGPSAELINQQTASDQPVTAPEEEATTNKVTGQQPQPFIITERTTGNTKSTRLLPWFRYRASKQNSTVWQVMAGTAPRLSLLTCFTLHGFVVDPPWEGTDGDEEHPPEDASQRLPQAPSVLDDSHYWSNSETFYWMRYMDPHGTNQINNITRMWEAILSTYGIRMAMAGLASFDLPPHTQRSIMTAKWSWDTAYLYMWFKRVSAVVGPDEIWQQAEAEVEEEVRS